MNVSPRQFLAHVFDGVPYGTWVELTFILPPELAHVGPSPITKSYRFGQTRPNWDWVYGMNQRGYGVYYSLTTKQRDTTQRGADGKRHRAREADAQWCSVLWVDIDPDEYYSSMDAAYNAVCDLLEPATAIIASGGGIHALWHIHPVSVENPAMALRVKSILKGLAVQLHSDPHVAELARVFRLPGTVNTKPARNGAQCEIIDWLPGVLSIDTFDAYAIRERPARQMIILPSGTRTNLPRWVGDYLESGAADGERNNRLYAATIEYRANGYTEAEAYRDLSGRALADGLEQHEIDATFRSGWDAPVGSANVSPSIAARVRRKRNSQA